MYTVRCVKKKLVIGSRTLIMGIVNVTPDSFSDGGNFLSPEQAVKHAEFLVKCGADIIDVGGESSRPFAEEVSVNEEMNRVLPVIDKLSKHISVPISIDTTKADVAREAMDLGASIINDISALSFDCEMAKVVAETKAGVILMHMRGNPKDMQINPYYDDLLEEVILFLSKAVDKAVGIGVNLSSIIIDPGLGFGKSIDHNFEIITGLNRLSKLGLPIMVGPSRKSFISKTLEIDSAKEISPVSSVVETGTQALIAAAVMNGANIIRVHNVTNTRATLRIIDGIKK